MRRQSASPRNSVETPAFIVRPAAIAASRDELARLCGLAGCRALYSLKALGLPDVLHLMVPQLAGFSASSLFEALLVLETGSNTPKFLWKAITLFSMNRLALITVDTVPNRDSGGLACTARN